MRPILSRSLLVCGFYCALILAQGAKAAVLEYITPSGSSGGDGPVNAEAFFSISGGTLTVTLDNLLQDPTAAGQLISGIKFNISGATGTGTFAGAGNVSTISAGGSYTAGTPSTLGQWEELRSGSTFTLDVFSGGKPQQMIIGPDSHGGFNPALGSYDNANSSITGHQPSVLGSATFTLTIPGITSGSTLSGIVFNFGTSSGEVSVNGQIVPDNGMTLALLGMALTSLLLFQRRFVKPI